MFVLIVLNCFKQSPTKTKLAMVRAASQSLTTERDIMLRYPGEKNVFYILFDRIIRLLDGNFRTIDSISKGHLLFRNHNTSMSRCAPCPNAPPFSPTCVCCAIVIQTKVKCLSGYYFYLFTLVLFSFDAFSIRDKTYDNYLTVTWLVSS